MCHKPAQIINTARMNFDTNFLTTYNGADLSINFNDICKCKHDIQDMISELNSNYDNCTDGLDPKLRYDIIKYNKKENAFIIFDSYRTMIYDSKVAFSDIKKGLSIKGGLSNEEKVFAYMKPLMINPTGRNIINNDNYGLYFNKLLASKGIEIQNDDLTKEVVKANWLKFASVLLELSVQVI